MYDGRDAWEDELLGDIEEATRHLRELEMFNPSLYAIISEGAKELSAMLDTQYSRGPCTLVKAEPDTTPISLSPEMAANVVYQDRRRRYACRECGKLHDRKARANDCRNADLGLKPYVCHGYCGQNSWFVYSLSSMSLLLPADALVATLGGCLIQRSEIRFGGAVSSTLGAGEPTDCRMRSMVNPPTMCLAPR